uniref:Adenylate cyclase n=1 Tax=uncultured bacterium contig00043 TaxID=1181530 RepID=A0A806KDG6_9BACT|nr:adenylate cyclase [uncultured bacterium contig00043]
MAKKNKEKKLKLKKYHIAAIITVVVFLAISGMHALGVFHFLEYKSYDFRVKLTANLTRPSDDIIVILLTQNCLDWAQKEKGWGWPWPRQAYAEVVDYMNHGNAASVAFDVLFSEPSVYRNARQDEIIDNMVKNLEIVQTDMGEEGNARRGEDAPRRRTNSIFMNIFNDLHSLSAREDDASFVKASQEYGKLIQAVFFSTQTGSAKYWPSNLEKPFFSPENFGSMLDNFNIGHDLGLNVGAQFPIEELREAAAALGSVTGKPDSDGIIRRLKLFTSFDGKNVPSLAAAQLMVAGQEQGIRYNEETSALEWGYYTIPVDKNGNTLLRYRGELDRYHIYNASDILKSSDALKNGDEPLLSPENFEDAYIFFGFYAPGLFDIFSTPINSVYPGMGCHITMLDNMLQGDFIRESAQIINLIILFVIVTLVVLLTMFSNRISLYVSGTIFITIVIILVSFGAYHWNGIWIPMITFIAGTLAAFISVTLYNYATEGSQKRFIKAAFSQYLSPKVVDQLILDPSQLKLGGEKREMTAIFTDIRGFSTFSEALGDPAKLVELLNFYLTRMSDIVLDNQGTIDKYEGDAIIAFFGAPIYMANHAALACRAAIGMKKAEPKINREAIENGLVTREVLEAMFRKGLTKGVDDPCQIFTRVGLNTGDMVVGNMGTPNKMDYTIMGNAVNLAARLEGINKQYHTGGILISEYTRPHIGDEFVVRPLSRVRVVGINTPLRLYELLDVASDAPPELFEMVKSWEEGFALYEKKDFSEAHKIFQSVHQNNDNDNAAKMYASRCKKYMETPPDEKAWDNGVDNLTEK